MEYVKVPYKPKRTVCIFVIIRTGQCKVKFSPTDNNIQNKFECPGMPNALYYWLSSPCGVCSASLGRMVREDRLLWCFSVLSVTCGFYPNEKGERFFPALNEDLEWSLPDWQETTLTSADLRGLLLGLWKIVTEILHSLSQGSCVSVLEDCWTPLFRELCIFSLTGHHSRDEREKEQDRSGRGMVIYTQLLLALIMGIKAGKSCSHHEPSSFGQ